MKRLLIVSCLLLASVSAQATSTDTAFKNIWDKVSASENFHLLDNATPASFYELKSGIWYAGVTTSVYKVSRLSLDFGAIKNAETAGHALPMAGLNVNIISRTGSDFDLLNNFALGLWGCRNFESGVTLYGVYGGYAAKFGGSND
jgi:hypothetical protein